MGTELRVERWPLVEAEIQGLFADHLAELGGGELSLDLELCRQLDLANAMLILTARDDSDCLLGYCIWTFGPSLEHSGEIVAELKPWYVRPESRKSLLAFKLFKESLNILRTRGISRCFPHHWGNKTLGRYFEHLGAKPIEYVYELSLVKEL